MGEVSGCTAVEVGLPKATRHGRVAYSCNAHAMLWQCRDENVCPVGWDPTICSHVIMIPISGTEPTYLLPSCILLPTTDRGLRNCIPSSFT